MALFYSKSTGGFYDDTIHSAAQIPADAVSITEAQHQALLAGQSDGQLIQADSNGIPTLVAPPAPALTDVQANALKSIDADAETLRGKYITANSGQVATYLMKYSEATAFQTAGYTGTVPGLVQSEVDATGQTAQQAADSILAQYAAWSSLAASIETARRKAKIAVNAATSTDSVNTAISTATTAFAAIDAAASASGATAQ